MTGTIHSFIYDTADIKGLASFYSQLLGLKEQWADEDWITLAGDDGRKLCFQLAPDHVRAQWPSQEFPQQFHLDLLTADMAGQTERAISLGATRMEGGGETWTVLTDPSGHPFCVCAAEGVEGLRWHGVAMDCPDGAALADFYTKLLDYKVSYSGPEGASIEREGHLPLMFQQVENYNAPRWPDPAYPQQAHIDISVDDVEAAEVEALKLGASKLPGGGGTTSGYRVFADPAGHPFCLVWGQ